MRFTTFIYVALILIGLNLQGMDLASNSSWMIYICIVLLLLVGLPHGAIDHVLSVDMLRVNLPRFYALYLATIAIYVALWVVLPTLSLLFFMLLSAFHFGESQLSVYGRQGRVQFFAFAIWGLHVLSAYSFYQYDALASHMASSTQFDTMQPVITLMGQSPVLMIVTAVILVFFVARAVLADVINRQAISQEIFVLALVHMSFIAFGPLVSFTLFFVVIHAMQVLSQEWSFLKERFTMMSPLRFVKMLLPLTVVSIAGIAGVYWVNLLYWDIPLIYLTLVMTAVITLPHAAVMHMFYDKSVHQ